MSSRYPILGNRPIDQWKVTELKEELKRRKLTTKGLKDDLIKRLDEALRIEREAAEAIEKDAANGFDHNPQSVAGLEDSQTVTVVTEVVDTFKRGSAEIVEPAGKVNTSIVEPIERENAEKTLEVVGNDRNKIDKLDGVTIPFDINNSVPALEQEDVGQKDMPAGVDSASVGEDLVVHSSTNKAGTTVSESDITEVVISGWDFYDIEAQKLDGDSTTKQENEDSKDRLENEDLKPQLDSHIEPPRKDVVPRSSARENQVSEVNPSLGSQVKSDSISSDSMSINEKNELKDNIIADNVKLEQEFVRPEMVEPPSSNIAPVYDEYHSMDVEELHEKKPSVEDNSYNVTSPDLKKTNSSEDVGYPERLILDKSSGDDSMEEDLPECKQFDSKFNADELKEKRESSEVPVVKEESGTKVVEDGQSAGISDSHQDNDIHSVVPPEKRKFHDQASAQNNEPAKRQRRWNSETVKVSDPQSNSLAPATTPKDEPISLKHRFSRSDSSATEDAPKECDIPQSQRHPTNSLRIDRFLRPFTLKAVQELLGKTGNVTSFWMDHIKTHCYVTYTSVEEAIRTRNAVYNLQWPPNGGRLLVAEFVDPQEVKMKVEAPPVQVASVSSGPMVPPAPPISQPEPSPRHHREQPSVPATLPPPPPLLKAQPTARERLLSPPTHPEKADPPIVTLDDLFRKTRATPRIYYLPLSEEQVAAKLAAQGKSTRQ